MVPRIWAFKCRPFIGVSNIYNYVCFHGTFRGYIMAKNVLNCRKYFEIFILKYHLATFTFKEVVKYGEYASNRYFLKPNPEDNLRNSFKRKILVPLPTPDFYGIRHKSPFLTTFFTPML